MNSPLVLQVELDATVITSLMHFAEQVEKLQASKETSTNFGPFTLRASGSGSIRQQSGTFVLRAPNVFGIHDAIVDFSLETSFSLDLKQYQPSWFPAHFPPITVPLHYSNSLDLSGDFELNPQNDGTTWFIKLIVVDALQIPVQAGAHLLDTLRQQVSETVEKALHLNNVPFIGSSLEHIVSGIFNTIGVEKALSFLQGLVRELVNGFTLYSMPKQNTLVQKTLLQGVPVEVKVTADIQSLSVTVSADNQLLILSGSAATSVGLPAANLTVQLSGKEETIITPVMG